MTAPPGNLTCEIMNVAFQGEVGAFSEEAARVLFRQARAVPMVSFEDVFEAVTDGAVEGAVIPIENTLFGSVHVNYDLLRTHDLHIVAEVKLRIRHHLMALPGVEMAGVRRVYSHPQALGQCQAFLRQRLPQAEVIPAYDTAGAAKMVADRNEREAAAIASEQAARVYGLRVLAAGIESNHQNYTRFLALVRAQHAQAQRSTSQGTARKTSIVYSMKENVPGALFKSLAVFALRDLDLFKIESRPLVGSPGNYLFYLDLEGSVEDSVVQRALEHLREIASYLKVLGSYPCGEVIE